MVWVWGVVMVRQGRRKKKESEASSFIRCLPWVISPPLSFTRLSAVYLQVAEQSNLPAVFLLWLMLQPARKHSDPSLPRSPPSHQVTAQELLSPATTRHNHGQQSHLHQHDDQHHRAKSCHE